MFLYGIPFLAHSENSIESSLSDCKKQLEALDNFQLNVSTLVYFNASSNKPGLTDDSKLIKKGDVFLILRKESIFLSDPQKTILVDKQLQSILVKFIKKSKRSSFDFIGLGDSTYKKYHNVELLPSERFIGYKLKYLNSIFSTAQLYFNAENKLIEKIIYHYNQEVSTDVFKCELLYQFLPKYDPSFGTYFSPNYFFSKSGKNYVPGSSFKNYFVQVIQD